LSKHPKHNRPASHRFRVIFILAAIFAASVACTLALRNTAQARGESPAARRPVVVASFPRMPADTEEKLANALTPQRITIPSPFFEPFVDRLERVSQSIAQAQPRPAKAEPSGPPPIPDFTARYRLWQEKAQSARAARMPAPPVTTVYLMAELEPVGHRTARGQQSVLIFVKPEQRVFAAPFGTDFYDATLEGADERGAIFRTATGLRSVEWSTNTVPLPQSSSGDHNKKSDGETAPSRTPASITPPDYAAAGATSRPRRVTQPDSSASLNARAGGGPKGGKRADILMVLQEAVKNRPVNTSAQPTVKRATPARRRGRAAKQQPNYVARGAISANVKPVSGVKGVRYYNDHYDEEQAAAAPAPQPVSYTYAGARYQVRAAVMISRLSLGLSGSPAFSARPVLWRAVQDDKRQRRVTPDKNAAESKRKTRSSPADAPPPSEQANAKTGVVTYTPPTLRQDTPSGVDPDAQPEASAPTRARRVTDDPAKQPPVDPAQAQSDKEPAAAPADAAPPADNRATPSPAPPATNVEPDVSTRGSFCDARFTGELYDITITRSIPFIDIADDLHNKFGVNFFVDADVQKTPVRISVEQAPWTSVLRTILNLNDLDAVCLPGNIIQIASRTKMAKLKEDRDKNTPLIREVFKLRYLQPVTGGRLNLAGQVQGGQGSANIQTLEEAIRRILRAGNDQRADVTRVPGRSEFIVVGTPDQIAQIRELIERVDKPGYQVVIRALVYTVNESRMKDIGPQFSAIVGNTSQSTLGGLTTFTPTRSSGTGGTGGSGGSGSGSTGGSGGIPVGRNPGGVGALGDGFGRPGNGLQTADPTAVIGVTTIVGTAQFSVQLGLALKKSVANIQARPFGTVENGNQLNLVAGTTIPVVTNTIVSGGVAPTGNVQFIEASRVLRITPQVAEDADGKPNYVTLEIQIENNSIDPSQATFGGLPVLDRQSLQTTLRLKAGETGVIGGLASDSVAKGTNGVPLLSSVPLLGRAFRREVSQIDRGKLYFAVTAEVVEQGAVIPNPAVPADATTEVPPAPAPQKPGPYDKKQ